MSFFQSIPFRARPAYVWYLRSQMLEGIFVGAVFQMIQIVGRKTIGVSEEMVILFSFFTSFGMFAVFIMPTLLNLRSQKQMIVWTSVPCKLLLASLALFTDPMIFFCIAALGLSLLKMQDPIRTSLLKTNLPATCRFRVVSHVRRMEFICFMTANFLAGYLMEWNGMWYRVIFPVSCLFSLAGTWMITQLREKLEDIPVKIISIRQFLGVMKTDKIYMQYQVLFSISGMVNLMGLPLYILYTVDVIEADFIEFSISRGILFGLASIISLTWWGRVMDRYPNPILMRAVLSLIWCLHPICYIAATDMTMIYIADAWFGFIFAGGQLNWMLGPLFFCNDREAPLYTTIHSFMNGIRGMIAPLLGIPLLALLGFIPTFILIAAVMFFNSIAIYWLYWKTKDLERFQPQSAVL